MKLPQVKQCCCGCSLETGTKIIAWLETICTVGLIIFAIIALTITVGHSTNDGREMRPPIKPIYFIIILLLGVYGLTMGILLLVGAYKRRLAYIKAWVAVTLVAIATYAIGVIVQVVLMICAGLYAFAGIFTILSIFDMCLGFYYVLVVSSFRKEILAVKGGP